MPRPIGRGKGKGKKDLKKRDRGNALFKRRKFCRFTAEKVVEIDYKDIDVLKDFLQENGMIMQITQKAGVDGRLFGSVTNVDVVDALKAQGIVVEKAMIRMPTGPLKQVGDHPMTVAPHHDVVANITVSVLG